MDLSGKTNQIEGNPLLGLLISSCFSEHRLRVLVGASNFFSRSIKLHLMPALLIPPSLSDSGTLVFFRITKLFLSVPQ